ncbi:YfiR/HmsC family protein [Vibrio albus]|uniref:YfiR/HmsC family protein n=1 Tax=Vibrio albus TaxID=2200953 RepID=UPI0015E84603|nr:YfiR/HmsC family protein [Vibrio albus]
MAADVSRNDLTAAYLFRLAENIQWPNSASISQYHIHLIDSNRGIYQTLRNISRQNKLNGKPFSVSQSRSTQVPQGTHLVYLAQSKSDAFADVLRQLNGKNTLLISDHVANKQEIMINLFENASQQVQFEINKANILNHNLGVNPDIILLGGTEIDVARLYREGQRQLQKLERQVSELNHKRQLLQESAARSEKEVSLLARDLKAQKQAIQQEKQRLAEAEARTQQQQQELEHQNEQIQRQETLITQQKAAVLQEHTLLKTAQLKYQIQREKLNTREQVITRLNKAIQDEQNRFKAAEAQTKQLQTFIRDQEQQVEEKLQRYEELTSKVSQQQTEISRQEEQIRKRAAAITQQDTIIRDQSVQLAQQDDIIGTQKNYLTAMGIAVILGVFQVLLILFGYRAKQKANKHLSQQNLLLEKTTKQLTITQKKAKEANQAKTIFLTTMSHELRTPLNAILGFSQLMQRDTSLPETQREKLNIINNSGEHLLGLINDVLELSKIEAGRITLNTQTFDLHRMLTELESIFKGRLEEKDMDLWFEKEDSLPRLIHTDQGKLRQILINLLGNALKFTEKGHIVLKASLINHRDSGQAPDHPLTDERAGLTLKFEITDTGTGIAPKDYSKIFAPFEQAEHGARKEGSTGLGLSISQRYAQLMGGQITFTSQLGVGSTFCVEINAQTGDQEEEEATPLLPKVASLAPGQEEIRILVVDDNYSNRLLLDKMLSEVGFIVKEAANGQEAMTLFEQWHPHLLLLDIKMPVMDGTEVTKRIRATDKDTGIIIISASVFEEQKQQLLDLGANAYIRKPVREEQLFSEIKQQLNIHYTYQIPVDKTEGHKLQPEDIAGLPETLRRAFAEAVLVGDIGRLNELVTEAEAHNAGVGSALRTMVEHFELNHIQALFDQDTPNTQGEQDDS